MLWALLFAVTLLTRFSESRPDIPTIKVTSVADVSNGAGRFEGSEYASTFHRALKQIIENGNDEGSVESDGNKDKDTSNDEQMALDLALWQAAAAGDLEGVKTALASGADANAVITDASGFFTTPLIEASQGGYAEVVQHLLEAGADPNFASNGGTALSNAARSESVAVVKALVEGGANLEARRVFDGATVLVATAALSGSLKIVEVLVDMGANVNATNKEGSTALFFAAFNGDTEVAELLIAAGAGPDMANSRGATPLIIAAQEGTTEVMEQLLEGGADPRIPNNHGATPLHLAAFRLGRDGKRKTKVLLASDLGVDIEARDEDGRTPLMWASRFGNLPVLRVLLEAGADRSAVDNRGRDAARLVCTCVDNEGYDPKLVCQDPGCSLPSTPTTILEILAG